MAYLVAKHIDKEGSILLKVEHGQELVNFKNELISLCGIEKIQFVTISRPSAYGEYEPYTITHSKEEFKEKAISL